ncbi:hypothetical protein EON80_07610, partial [bacterium]
VFPTLSEALGSGRVAVGQEYFSRVMAPIGLLLLALTGVAPLLPWRRATWKGVWRAIKFPALWSIPFLPVLWILSQYRTGAATAFCLSVFVFLAIGWEVFRGVKTLMAKRREGPFDAAATLVSFNPARYGGYIVHLGIAIIMVGFTGSSVFKIEHDPISLKKGESTRIGEYTLRFDGLARPDKIPDNLQDQVVALVTVFDQNGQITPKERPLDPHIDFFKNTAAQDATGEEVQQAHRPCIRTTLANDLYLVLAGFDTKDNSASIKAYMNPLVMWIWISVGFFVLGTVVAMLPVRRGNSAGSAATTKAPAVDAPREKELVA